MKQKLTLLLIILIGIFIFPFKTDAQIKMIEHLDINEHQDVVTDKISITGIKFNNYSQTSSQSYGLSGYIQNHTNNALNIKVVVTYFDKDKTILSQSVITETLDALSSSQYIQMSNLNTLSTKYTVNDIAYYDMNISTTISRYDTTLENNNLTPSLDVNNQYKEYVIDAYDIKISVNENNTLDIVETITAYFNVPKHGIYRKIPLKNNIIRMDGTTSSNRTKVTNLTVDNEYTTSRSTSEYEVKIGSADYTVTGEQTYKISYTYNLGKDPMKEYDEFYFNLIGTEWDTVIGNVTFTITMPKDFDASKLGFSSGEYGSTVNDDIKYEINDKVITGEYNGILSSGQALTVRLELEEGYFVGAGFDLGIGGWLLLIVPILALLISYLLWHRYGNDDNVVETIEFYPPNNMNSLQVGYAYKGTVTNEDIVSLLIYLANKGYIKIEEYDSDTIFGGTKKDFRITKLKEYDGTDKNEQIFLDGLFKKKKYSYSKLNNEVIDAPYTQSVTSSDLTDKFYKTMNKIMDNINSKKNQHIIYEKSSLNKRIFVILLMIVSLITTVSIPTIDFSGFGMVFVTAFITVFYIPFYTAAFSKGMPTFMRIFLIIFLLIHSGAFMYSLPITEAVLSDPFYLLTTLFGIACLIGMIIIFHVMPKRTPYGNKMLGKLRGFKTFLETAEKTRLEALVMENPNYFYDILPYTYVLGVSDKWISKFERIAVQEPDWYVGRDHFSVKRFGNVMSSTMTSARTAMSSSPSSGGGSGGSSGGGSSGGGSGGGGGGSW